MKQKITIFSHLCKGCGLCILKCPVKAIKFSKTKLGYYGTPTVEANESICISCGICETICPDCALVVSILGT